MFMLRIYLKFKFECQSPVSLMTVGTNETDNM